MKVILRKDIRTLGNAGDVKEVKPGYGRNYLIPNKLAEMATPGALKNWQLGSEQRKKRADKALSLIKAGAEKINGSVLSFSRRVGENGQLFGSVGKSDIVKSLKASGFEIEKDCVVLENPIKIVGDTEVELSIKSGVSAKIKVRISAKSQ